MRKLPLLFPLLLAACASPKQAITQADHNVYTQPYTISYSGVWRPGYSVLTLVDANNKYFTVKTRDNANYVRGALYAPIN